MPTVVLDPPGAGTPFVPEVRFATAVYGVHRAGTAYVPEVRFATAVYGVHRAGTAYRMDEVPLPAALPSDGDVLRAVTARLG